MMELSTRTLGDWLEHWALTTPNKEYIVYSDRNLRFTWKQFNERVDHMAKGLLAIGVKRGTHVGIWAGNVPDWLTDWMRVEELVEMFRDFYGTPSQAKAYIGFDADKANEMLARLNIAPNARLKTLSKGNKEKVQLVLAMSRNARLYLLDEPIGGVDPAARDYILNTIISNYSKDATVVISTHLIEDIEPVLDEAVFLKDGRIFAHRAVDDIRETEGKSVDAYFREVFKC